MPARYGSQNQLCVPVDLSNGNGSDAHLVGPTVEVCSAQSRCFHNIDCRRKGYQHDHQLHKNTPSTWQSNRPFVFPSYIFFLCEAIKRQSRLVNVVPRKADALARCLQVENTGALSPNQYPATWWYLVLYLFQKVERFTLLKIAVSTYSIEHPAGFFWTRLHDDGGRSIASTAKIISSLLTTSVAP